MENDEQMTNLNFMSLKTSIFWNFVDIFAISYEQLQHHYSA